MAVLIRPDVPVVVQQDVQQMAPLCAQLEIFFAKCVSIAFTEEVQIDSGPV